MLLRPGGPTNQLGEQMYFSSDRSFQMWDYCVSHQQLLFRSPRSAVMTTNVDILLWGVKFLNLSTFMSGIVIEDALPEELLTAKNRFELTSERGKGFCFISQNIRFLVVADNFKVFENTLDIFDSTIVNINKLRPKEAYGRILASTFPVDQRLD